MSKENKQIDIKAHGKGEAEAPANLSAPPEMENGLSTNEREIVQEILRALRAIRYGSVVITVHDGHAVEIQKTERIRRGRTNLI